MGRKGSWFTTVKKVFISSDAKKEQKPHLNNQKSKLGCFSNHQELEDSESGIAVVPALPKRREPKPKTEEAGGDQQQNKQAFSLVLATAVAAGAAVAAAQAAAAAEVARLRSSRRFSGKPKDEIAAIKIQTAFRGYLARRSLRGRRGLARLRTLVKGQTVQRQAATTLQCMQTLSRLQTQVRARKIRMAEENQSFQRQLLLKRQKEIEKLQAAAPVGDKWDLSKKTKEQVEANLMQKQVAALRREKAMAYASTHQQTWKNGPKPANVTIMDPHNPHWGWNWLDRWMATRPWEGQNTVYENNPTSEKNAVSHTMSVGQIAKLYTQRDQNQEVVKNSPSPPVQKQIHRARSNINSPSTNSSSSRFPPSTPRPSRTTSSGPRGGSWGGESDTKHIFSNNSSENNRRHSIAVSPSKENDESPRAAKAKTKMPSTPSGLTRNGAFEKGKKQLSFPASAVGTRRHSVPPKVGLVSNKTTTTTAAPKRK